MNLYYNTTAQCRVDENNTRIAAKPIIHYGACPTWELHFFSGDPGETPEPVDLSDIVSWRAAVDSDWISSTEPMCRTLDADIDASQAADGIIAVPVNANTQRYLTVVDGKQSVGGWFELRGFDDQGNVALVVLLTITCSNSIDPTGGAEPEPVDNDTATMTWVKAVIAQQLYFQYSADGTTWHNPPMIPDTDVYFRIRHGENGTPSAAQLIPYGHAPHIGDNGHWFIGPVDTGVTAELSGNTLTFNSVSSNTVTFSGTKTLPFGVLTNSGHFYPVEKGSLTIDQVNDTFTLDITPYLAYDDSASFSGTWKLYMCAGSNQNPIKLGPCTGLGFANGSSGPSFSWIDPDDVILNGAELARWNQTVLVRKTGTSYPTSPEDGVILATTSRTQGNKNYYRDHSFTDDTQESGTDYRYMLFSQADNGSWNNLVANQYTSGIGLSWDMVKQYVRAGRGTELFPVGTVFYVDHSEYTHQDSTGLWFRVAGHDQVPAADESLTHSMCLEMVDCLFQAPYDAAELEYALTEDTTAQGGKTYYILSGSTYTALTVGTDYDIGDPIPVASWYEKNLTGRSTYGSNNPKQNNCINWFNSDGSAGSSIQPMTIWDQCGSALLTRNGFLKNIDPLFLAVVQPARLTTALCNPEGGGSITHTAKFWPLSLTQVFGTLNNGVTENIQLQYYADGGSHIKNIKDTETATAWWLRSPYPSYANVVYSVQSESYDYASAYGSRGFSIACIIA